MITKNLTSNLLKINQSIYDTESKPPKKKTFRLVYTPHVTSKSLGNVRVEGGHPRLMHNQRTGQADRGTLVSDPDHGTPKLGASAYPDSFVLRRFLCEACEKIPLSRCFPAAELRSAFVPERVAAAQTVAYRLKKGQCHHIIYLTYTLPIPTPRGRGRRCRSYTGYRPLGDQYR